MTKKSKLTDSVVNQIEGQVVQTKFGLASIEPKSPRFVNSKEVTQSKKGDVVAKEKIDEEELDLSADAGAENASDPIILAEAGIGTATDAAASSASSAAGGAGAEAGAAAGSGAAAGGAAAGAAAISGGTLGLVGLGVVGVAAAASGGGGAAAASAAGFTLTGVIALGRVSDNTGLTVEAFKADGTVLAGGTGTVNADGTFTIAVTENYTGPVLIRLKDTNAGTNYTDEGTGSLSDLTTDLRVVVNVSGNGTIQAMLTPLTELAVRELLGDSGGDGGTAGTTLGAITATQAAAANDSIEAAFGLTGDIVTTAPVTVDVGTATFTAATAAQQAYGQALAAISGAEANLGMDTGEAINAIAQGLTGGVLSQSVVDELLAGAVIVDAVAGNATGTATALAAVIGSNISGIGISADTGSVGDFITGTAAQTITATLDTALSGTKLWGSLDGGTTWTDISSFVTTTALSWTGVTLNSGDNLIKFAVTADTVAPFTGAAADIVTGTKVSVQNYGLDTANPAYTSSTTANFAENGTGTAYTAVATDAHLLTYTLTGTDAALFNLDPSSGAVTFQTVPNFEAPADAGGNNVYDIAVTATDGAGNSSIQSVAITVTNANEAPTLTSGAAASLAENGTGTVYTAAGTDPDAATTLTYALGGADAALFNINSGTGAVTFATAPNFEAPADAGANNVYNVTVTASDGTNTTAAQAVAITVTNVNEPPALTSGAAASFAENATGTAYTAAATDQDAGTTLTYALGGADAALFNIDSSSGVVTFASAPNFETPTDAGADNVYDITVTASDGANTTAPQAVAITVTNVNEAPTSTTIAPASAAVNQPYSLNVSGNFSDVDAGNVFSYGATGLPAGLSINTSTGVISGTATALGASSVTVTATDSGGLATSKTFNLSVLSAPVISSIAANVAQAQSGDALTLLVDFTEAVTVVGTPTLTLNVGGTPMTATYISGTGNPTLTFTATATTGDSAAVSVTAINLNGGTITGNVTAQSLVTTAVGQAVSAFVIDNTNPAFTSAATANFAENGAGAAYATAVNDATPVVYTLGGTDAALFNISASTGAVTFISAPNFEAPADAGADNVHNVIVTATDALGHVTNQSVAITVTNVNEMPTLTSGAAASLAENGAGTVYTATGTDPDAATTLTYALGGTDAALFNISSGTGAVTFASAPNFEAPADAGGNNVYDITVTASDGTNTTAAQAVAITVTNVNEMPTLTSGTAASFAENATGTVYTAVATDAENAALTYALGGTDAALFAINASTGAVTFAAPPNFEVPADAGVNNVYDITVTASDGANTTAAQAVAITVTGVNEAPTSEPPSSATFVVNQAFSDSIVGAFSDVDAGNVFSYSATGLPTGIALNPSTGAVSGTPTATGTFNVVFTATDSGGLTASHTATVNVVSAPAITSTIDNVTNLEVTSNIVLHATENVTAVASKYIHIINDGGAGFHGEATTNTQDILVTDATKVTITSNTITINPGFDLDFANDYHIMVDVGAFLGVTSGQGSVVTADAAAMNFSTVLPSASATATASQAMVSGADAMVAGHSWWDAEGFGTPGGASVARDFAGGDFVITANDLATTGIATNDFYIAVNNFAAGDLIYVDNHGDNAVQRQADFNNGLIIDMGTAPTTIITGASNTATGQNGGQFDVTVAGSAASFTDTAALQVLLGSVTYQPVLYG